MTNLGFGREVLETDSTMKNLLFRMLGGNMVSAKTNF